MTGCFENRERRHLLSDDFTRNIKQYPSPTSTEYLYISMIFLFPFIYTQASRRCWLRESSPYYPSSNIISLCPSLIDFYTILLLFANDVFVIVIKSLYYLDSHSIAWFSGSKMIGNRLRWYIKQTPFWMLLESEWSPFLSHCCIVSLLYMLSRE